MESRAILRYCRMAPRKVALAAGLVRGRNVNEALAMLQAVPRAACPVISKLIRSAMANAADRAKQGGVEIDVDRLVVRNVLVDNGPMLKRWMPRARGMANRILKRTCHISVALSEPAGTVRGVSKAAEPRRRRLRFLRGAARKDTAASQAQGR